MEVLLPLHRTASSRAGAEASQPPPRGRGGGCLVFSAPPRREKNLRPSSPDRVSRSVMVSFSPASPPPLPPPLGARGEREAGFGVRAFAVAAVVAFGLLGCCRRPAALTHCSGAVKASLWRPAAAGERRPGLDCPTFFAAQGLTGPNVCATMVVRGWLPGALHPSRKGVRGPEEEARTERFGLLFLPGLSASFGVSFSTAFPQSCCKATAFFRLTFPKKSTAPPKNAGAVLWCLVFLDIRQKSRATALLFVRIIAQQNRAPLPGSIGLTQQNLCHFVAFIGFQKNS